MEKNNISKSEILQIKINKFIKWIDSKKLSVIFFLLFIISMIPIWYLAFYARPSGDDFGYATRTHIAWLNTHSLAAVFRASIETTKHMCNVWNGDWFTVFLFTWMPEVFVPYSFWIVPILMTLATIFATEYLCYEILVNRIGFKWYESLMVASLILTAIYQFIPSTAIGMYWYVGTIHYIFPHIVALLLLGFLSGFERTGRIKYIVYSAFGTIMVGGSSYFSSLLVFMIYFVVILICMKKNKKILCICVPFLSGIIALFFQITAPGNAVRGGQGFGFSFSMIISTIIRSLIQGGVFIGNYLREKTFVFILFAIMSILMWECLIERKSRFVFKWPGLFCIFMYGLYSAMFAPEIYAAVEVSLGPATMQYITFILSFSASIIYFEVWAIQKLRKRNENFWILDIVIYKKYIMFPVLVLCGLVVLTNRGMLSSSVFNRCWEYVESGQAEDFKMQIASQMEILLDENIKEAYLCPINNEQGPLMHMPVTEDINAFTNRVVADFYEKDFVIMEPGN